MTTRNNLTHPDQPVSLTKPIILGAGIALLLIILFLSGVDDPKPEWGQFWMIRPLVVVPLAGAMGGAFFYFMDQLRIRSRWNRILTVVLSLIGYIIVLWLGTVLGLDGTLWN